MTPPEMTPQRLQELLDAHGVELERWPQPEGAAARALCERDPVAAALVAEARALEDLLLEARLELAPSPQLQRRVAEIPLRHPRRQPAAMLWPFGGALRTLMAGAFTLALGLATGLSTLELAPTDEQGETESWEEFESLALGPELYASEDEELL